MRKFHQPGKGFTMAELLVVIAIMAILVGVAVGSFTGLIGSGESTSGDYEKEAVQTAVDAYMSVEGASTLSGSHTRTTPDVIEKGDQSGDAPFVRYMRRLPTDYTYTWNSSGSVTQHGKS